MAIFAEDQMVLVAVLNVLWVSIDSKEHKPLSGIDCTDTCLFYTHTTCVISNTYSPVDVAVAITKHLAWLFIERGLHA